MKRLLPGLLLVCGIAVVADALHGLYEPLSAVAIAIVLGLLIGNLVRVPEACRPGITFAVKRVLRIGIVLLGIRLSFTEMLQTGSNAIVIVVICITTALLLVQLLGRLLRVPARLGTLIAVGSAICGNSAIVATAPAIEAEEEEVSFAVATISLFGLLAVIVYPVVGHLLGMTQSVFGIWAGTAINDTSQVVTAGFIFGEEAGKAATVVKLTRNLFMAPVIMLMCISYGSKARDAGGKCRCVQWKKAFPLFVLGFVGMAALRTLGVFNAETIRVVKGLSGFLIVTAIAGVGLNTNFGSMKKLGLKPFYVGLAASLIMGGVSYLLIRLMGTG